MKNCTQRIYKLLLKFLLSELHALSGGRRGGLHHDTKQPGDPPWGQTHTQPSGLLQDLPPPGSGRAGSPNKEGHEALSPMTGAESEPTRAVGTRTGER